MRLKAERAAVVLKGQTCEVTGVEWAAGGQVCTLFNLLTPSVDSALLSSPHAPTMDRSHLAAQP